MAFFFGTQCILGWTVTAVIAVLPRKRLLYGQATERSRHNAVVKDKNSWIRRLWNGVGRPTNRQWVRNSNPERIYLPYQWNNKYMHKFKQWQPATARKEKPSCYDDYKQWWLTIEAKCGYGLVVLLTATIQRRLMG